MDWTANQDETLRRLWREGKTSREIATQIGVTKNAVVGRAHRIGCDLRASPIKRVQVEPFVPPPDSIPRVKALDYPIWSSEEIAVLERYPDASSKWLSHLLLSRSYFSIQEKRTRLRVAAERRLPPKPVQVRKATRPVIVAPPPTPAPPVILRVARGQCSWLDGERAPYRQCETPAIVGPEGCVWCGLHRRRVYTRRGEVAA